jgi:hypothetical protein
MPQAAQAVITRPCSETSMPSAKAEGKPTLIHTSIPRPGNTPAYRRHVYFWMRQEVRMPHPGGQISRRTALEAWKRSKQYVEALS